ncbi:hypothetical protein F5051DRAFT_325219 [Lentinula edodes]|uniref:Uncharacterized protein n=1 Tax=Lentinula lateritia TaxID=40482 RepID=A0A9W9DZU9_9AGAR|nr:hypothetical protein F5051DRAFT_325219 [Lentinula edodes]KAJ4493682.1 hypothetical protein C8J55DRAFT_555109 [Lentinula edodes]
MASLNPSNPIQLFFSSYSEFTYDPSGKTMAQFWELCNLYSWDRNSDERAEALAKMRDAIAQQFNAFYGTDADSLDGWYNLFQALQVQIPDTVKGCKDLIRTIHVNICDLVDYSLGEQNVPPELHVSQEALAEYSRREGKIYPRENAYAEGLLRFLLREITGTYQGRRGKDGQRRGGRRGRLNRRGRI